MGGLRRGIAAIHGESNKKARKVHQRPDLSQNKISAREKDGITMMMMMVVVVVVVVAVTMDEFKDQR